MADVRLGIDAQGAVEGTAQFEQQVARLLSVLGNASEGVDRFESALARVGRAGAQSGGLPESLARTAQATEAAATAQQSLTQAQQQGAQIGDALSRQLAALDRDVQTHVKTVDALTDSSEELARQQDRQIQVGLTLLGTLGGSERAFSGLTRAQLRYAENQGQLVDRAAVLASVQERVRTSADRMQVVFSTAAVNARDLRANMANLSNQATNLATSLATGTGGLLGNFAQIRNVMREIRLELGDLRLFGGGGSGGVGGAIAGGSGLDRFGTGAESASGGITVVSGSLARLIPVAAAATAGLALVGTAGLGVIAREGAKAEVELAKINGVIAATGNAAGITGQRVAAMVSDIVQETGRAGAEINSTAAQLLTFFSISGDSFERALRLSVDLGVIFGSTSAAASSLGKALEDPIGGLGALARTGTKFTEGQKEQIRVLVESGRLLEAQGIIFEALEKQAAGVAEQVGNTLVGAWGKLTGSIGDALTKANEWIGVTPALTRAINNVNDALRDVTAAAFPDPQSVLSGLDQQVSEAEARLERLRASGFRTDDPLTVLSPARFAERDLERLRAARDAAFEALQSELVGAFDADSRGRTEQLRLAADAEAERLDKLGEKFKTTTARAEEYRRTVLEIRELSKAGVGDAEQAKLIEEAGKRIFGQAEGLEREAKAATASRDARKGLAAEIDREREARERVQGSIEQEIADRERGIEVLRRELEATREGPEAVRALSIELEIEEAVRRRRNEAAAVGLDIDQATIAQIDEQIRERSRLTDAIAKEDRARQEADRRAAQQAEERQRLLEEPFLEARRNVQDAFSTLFEEINKDGVDSFQDLANDILDIFKRAPSEDLAAVLTNLVLGDPTSTSGGSFGGIVGSILGVLGVGGQSAPGTSSTVQGPPAPTVANGGLQGPPAPQGGGIGDLLGSILGGIGGQGGGGGGGIGNILGSVLGGAGGAGGVGGNLGGYLTAITSVVGGIVNAIGGIRAGDLNTAGTVLRAIENIATPIALTILSGPLSAALSPLIDSIMQALLGGLFRATPNTPRGSILTLGPNDPRLAGTGVDSAFQDDLSASTPFGQVGFSNDTTRARGFDFGSTIGILRGLDQNLARGLSEQQIAAAAAALQNQTKPFFVQSFNNSFQSEIAPITLDRANVILNATTSLDPTGSADEINRLSRVTGQPVIAKFLQAVNQRTGEDINPLLFNIAATAITTGGKQFDTELFAKNFGEITGSRNEAISFFDQTLGRTPEATEASQSIQQLEKQFRALRDSADFLLLPLEDIDASFGVLREKLNTDFVQSITDQILGLEDPLALALLQQQRANEALIANAEALGVGLDDVLRLNDLRIAEINKQFAEQAAALDPFGELISALTERPGAPLPAKDLLANIGSRVGALTQGANAGDAKSLADLPEALAELVNQAQVVFGAGGQFGEIYSFVLNVAEQFKVQPEASARSITVSAPPIVDAIDNGTAENAQLMAEQNAILQQMAAQIEALQLQMLQQSLLPTTPMRVS